MLRAFYSCALEKYSLNEQEETWVELYSIRQKILFSDPEAWKLTTKDGIEEKVILRSSETASFFTTRRIGAILSEMGFNQKKRKSGSGNYQRKAPLKKIKVKANTLNIQLDDIDKEKHRMKETGRKK